MEREKPEQQTEDDKFFTPRVYSREGCKVLRSLVGEDVYFFSQKEDKVVCAKVEHVEVTLGPKGEVSVAFDLLSSDGGLGKRWLVPALYVHQDEETAWKFAKGILTARPSANTWALDRVLGELGGWLVMMGVSPQAEAPTAEAPTAEAPQAEAPEAEAPEQASTDTPFGRLFPTRFIPAGLPHMRTSPEGEWPVDYRCEEPERVDYDTMRFARMGAVGLEHAIEVVLYRKGECLRASRGKDVTSALDGAVDLVAERMKMVSEREEIDALFPETLILAGVTHQRTTRAGRWPIRYVCEKTEYVNHEALRFYDMRPWSMDGISVHVMAGGKTLHILRCDDAAQAISMTSSLIGMSMSCKKV